MEHDQRGEQENLAEYAEEDELTVAERQFIEESGSYYEAAGISRIGGRLIGLLMIADRPLALDEIARLLTVSRASVSTNARIHLSSGLVQRVSRPGDRRDYYVIGRDAWMRRMEAAILNLRRLRRVNEHGLEAIHPENTVAEARLEEEIAFLDFIAEAMRTLIQEWQQQKSQLVAKIEAVHHGRTKD